MVGNAAGKGGSGVLGERRRGQSARPGSAGSRSGQGEPVARGAGERLTRERL